MPKRRFPIELEPLHKDPGRAGIFFVLAFLLYGRHLGDGYLADDFLYLAWLADGPGELLRRLTVDSNPQMIRPLPALGWLLSGLPGGFAWQHGLALLLHGLCAALIARLVESRAAERGAADHEAGTAGLVAGALFVSFPLFTEPVLWLSASPDLWASALALVALERLVTLTRAAPEEPKSVALFLPSCTLFALALLCKESVLLLPILLPLLLGRRPWREMAWLGSVAALYLGLRWWLFGGVGGYLDAAGRSLALDVDVPLFLRNAVLQWPYRLLQPLKGGIETGWATPTVIVFSSLLLAAFLLTSEIWRRRAWPDLVRAAAVLVLALLPAASVFSVDIDHENARLLYFPLAVALVAAGPALAEPRRFFGWAAALLVVFWGVAATLNARPWIEASREVRDTLRVLAAIESRFPADSTVLVAENEIHHGAYVWRNGLGHAAALSGLRRDLVWRRGSAALFEESRLLGRRAFEIAVEAPDRWIDWTPCARALSSSGASSPTPSGRTAGAAEIELSRPAAKRLGGRLRWRRPGGRFTLGAARRFVLPAGARRVRVRLPWEGASETLELQALFDVPLPGGTAATVRGVARPPACAAVERRLDAGPAFSPGGIP